MPPAAYIVHAAPGRLRVRIPSKRGDLAYFAAVRKAFSDHPDISGLETNATTGGVLLRHNSENQVLPLREHSHGLFTLQEDPVPKILDTIARGASGSNGSIRRNTGLTNTESLLFLTLAGMGAYQLLRGQVLAPATTLLWYAWEIARRRGLGPNFRGEV